MICDSCSSYYTVCKGDDHSNRGEDAESIQVSLQVVSDGSDFAVGIEPDQFARLLVEGLDWLGVILEDV
jgi:hypothetical protein